MDPEGKRTAISPGLPARKKRQRQPASGEKQEGMEVSCLGIHTVSAF
jgi:hypothetical protein